MHIRLGRGDAVGAAGLLFRTDVEVLGRPLEQLHRLRGVAIDGNDDVARHGEVAVYEGGNEGGSNAGT